MQSKYSKLLTIGLVVIIIIIIGLLIIWGVSALSDKQERDDIDETIIQYENRFIKSNTAKNNTVSSNIVLESPYANTTFEDENLTDETQSETGKAEYKGFTMIGYIEIPATSIKYPILEETSTKALETSICKLYGVGLNKEGNTVLVGHNYRNKKFFSDNAKLAIGDIIYITDETGQRVTYTIYHKYQTTPEDADYATRAIDPGVKEITLSTCTDDSSARTIILARAN